MKSCIIEVYEQPCGIKYLLFRKRTRQTYLCSLAFSKKTSKRVLYVKIALDNEFNKIINAH